MLRTVSNSLTKTVPTWRNATVYSSLKQYTTPATPAPAENEKKAKAPLSQRLGGTGRGKVLDNGSADPFASFLANAKKPRGPNNNNNNNDRRNGNFTPRPRKSAQGEKKGQFADAAEGNTERKPRQPRQQNAEGARNNNNNNRPPRTQQRTPKEGATLTEGDNKRPPRTNNRNNNNNNRDNNRDNKNGDNRRTNAGNNKRMNFNRSQPQEVRTRRAVTFIDKDIDWASFDTMPETQAAAAVEQDVKEDSESLLKDVQGDYDRYLAVGSELSWSSIINGASVSTLVGSNPTFDISQKTAFLAAVSKATGGNQARK